MTPTPSQTPLDFYHESLEHGGITFDAAQKSVIERLDLLHACLNAPDPKSRFWTGLFWGQKKITPLRGLYIHGAVGRGKSFLMDLFISACGSECLRQHFYDFMHNVHRTLDHYRQMQSPDPLEKVAQEYARNYRILALDEMQVENIADAMILSRFFSLLFKAGVVLVATSNRHPDDLYQQGLNRHRFMPFLDVLKQHCEIVELVLPRDYRLEKSSAVRRYFHPLDDTNLAAFDTLWAGFGVEGVHDLPIGSRFWRIKTRSQNDKIAVCLDFKTCCMHARGARDYQALGEFADIVFLKDVPILDKEHTSAAGRFITLIDILYETRTTLYLGLAADIDAIHGDPMTAFTFQRTRSRLAEMTGEAWPGS